MFCWQRGHSREMFPQRTPVQRQNPCCCSGRLFPARPDRVPWRFACAGWKHISKHSTDTPSPWSFCSSPHSPQELLLAQEGTAPSKPMGFWQESYLQYQSGRGRLAHRTQGVIRHTGVSAESIFSGLLDPDRAVFQQVPAGILHQGEPGSSLIQHPPQLLISPSAKPPTHA